MGLVGRIVVAMIAVAVALAIVVAIWTAAPDDGRGLVLLAAAAIGLALYGVLFTLQRRFHW
jgi:hypothetical protein